ncbi:gp53-like domain-containing protein [Azospirillum brasilense]|uniref:gp53-like domain-containing protein n=1 Tax=Azospirillum brasilense TaxID=192 RepID=UPI0018D56BBF|nr:hypothetical protein [Azospirillum brasilense]
MLYDRVEQTTTTTGTGALSLIAPSDASRRSFVQAAGSGTQVFYCIETLDQTQYEYGIGTCTAGSPDILTRTTVLLSSNANALVNFPSGTKRVFSCLPAARSGIGTTPLTSTWAAGLSGNGWVRLPIGLIVQWGTNSFTNTSAYQTQNITFPILFPTGLYAVVAGNGDIAAQPTALVGVAERSQSSFNCRCSITSGVFRIDWVAFGI